VEFGLPAHLRDIRGKNGARYVLSLSPLESLEVDRSLCSFNHRDADAFKFLPTAHTDIHFVPESLADFYFEAVKEIFETDYRTFLQMYNFTTPGKYHIFVSPCLLSSVIWDERFGQSIDPTSSSLFVVFGHESNSTDPFALLQCAVLRNLGYAPAFLSEGLANYISFAIFDMKRLITGNQVPPLRELLRTHNFYMADPVMADRVSATVVHFLIDSRGYPLFHEVYSKSDDLSLIPTLEATYGLSIEELEMEWRHYVDTVAIPTFHYRQFTERAEVSRKYDQMLRYASAYFANAPTKGDTLAALMLLKRAYFFAGNYYKAAETIDRLIEIQSERARNWMERAAYKMMNGYYEPARADLLQAQEMDSTDQLVRFNLAMNYLVSGETEEAGKLFLELATGSSSEASREARIYLAEILRESGDADEKSLATAMLQEAARQAEQEISVQRSSASAYLWCGIAYLGLGDTGQASDYLNVALFLESRPFYIGLIYLSLGKVADALGDRTAARDFYQQVLAVQSAHYHQEQAKKYLEHPFQL
jgi:tetratricopeptide (TPR) repeat protein